MEWLALGRERRSAAMRAIKRALGWMTPVDAAKGVVVIVDLRRTLGRRPQEPPEPSTAMAIARVAARMPHLAGIAATVAGRLAKPAVRPVLLHGRPGAGKTLFAVEMCRALGLEPVVHACGGDREPLLGGYASRPHAGVALRALCPAGSAGRCVILDGVDRAMSLDAPRAVVQARLYGILVIATATFLGTGAAREDLFEPIEVPSPAMEHAPALIEAVSRTVAEERGLDGRWAERCSDAEIEMIARTWGGGSIRCLRDIVEETGRRAAADRKRLAN
jgi:hypothetical protein